MDVRRFDPAEGVRGEPARARVEVNPRIAVLVIAVVIAFVCGACGGGNSSNGEEKKPATQILADTKAAILKAKSFHISGQSVDSGKTTALDVTLSPTRSGGSITSDGATLQLVVGGGEVYMKADQASWRKLGGSAMSAAAAQLVADRWVKAPTTNADFKDLAKIGDLKSFLNEGLQPEGQVSKHAVTTVDGKRVLPLVDGTGSTLYIAATGPPYVVKIDNTAKASGGAGTLTFDHYGNAAIPAIPNGAVDLSALEKG